MKATLHPGIRYLPRKAFHLLRAPVCILWEMVFSPPVYGSISRRKTFLIPFHTFFFFNFHKPSLSTLTLLTEIFRFLLQQIVSWAAGYQILGNLLGCVEFLLLNQSLAWLPLQAHSCYLFSFFLALGRESRKTKKTKKNPFSSVGSQQKIRQAWEMGSGRYSFRRFKKNPWKPTLISYKYMFYN